MALAYYMTITAKAQGNIEGSAMDKGHEKEIQCHALDQTIRIPYDPINGRPTGTRIHGPIKVTKCFDKSSPKLYQALVTGELLTEVKLTFSRIAAAGIPEKYFQIELAGAQIVEIRPYMLNHYDPVGERYENMEEVSINYEQITWTHLVDSITTTDVLGPTRA